MLFRSRTPAQLRELVIHQLTITAVSDEVSVRDRLTALKMLGTVSEVSAFTERKESLVIHESSKVKQQLLDQLKTIVNGEIVEAASSTDEGEELLAQLAGVRASKPDSDEAHPQGITPNLSESSDKPMHNIPLTESPSESPTVHENSTGVGVVEKVADAGWVETGEAPLSDLGTMENGEG